MQKQLKTASAQLVHAMHTQQKDLLKQGYASDTNSAFLDEMSKPAERKIERIASFNANFSTGARKLAEAAKVVSDQMRSFGGKLHADEFYRIEQAPQKKVETVGISVPWPALRSHPLALAIRAVNMYMPVELWTKRGKRK